MAVLSLAAASVCDQQCGLWHSHAEMCQREGKAVFNNSDLLRFAGCQAWKRSTLQWFMMVHYKTPCSMGAADAICSRCRECPRRSGRSDSRGKLRSQVAFRRSQDCPCRCPSISAPHSICGPSLHLWPSPAPHNPCGHSALSPGLVIL